MIDNDIINGLGFKTNTHNHCIYIQVPYVKQDFY